MKKRKTKKRAKEKNRMLMVVDGSNLAFRVWKKFEKMKSRKGIPTGMMYGFLRVLHNYVQRFKPKYILVSFDTKQGKTSNFRNKILDSYKAQRKRIDFDYISFNRQMRQIKRILIHLNIPVIWDSEGLGFESDDYIAWAANNFPGKVLIVSSDKDFTQLIDERVKMYNPSKETYVTKDNCKELFGWEPSECVDYLTLLGDSSDNIKGYSGMGPVKIRQFLDQFGSIHNYIADKNASFKHLDKDGLPDLWLTNTNLISLYYSMGRIENKGRNIPIQYSKTGRVETRRLKKIFHRYTFMSFTTEEFINNFKDKLVWNLPEQKK